MCSMTKQTTPLINVDSLREQIIKNNVRIIDVRRQDDYQNGHIVNSVNLPLAKLLADPSPENIVKIAEDLGIPVEVSSFARDEIYIADEAFFTGTAAEVTPIREVDGSFIGGGKPGEITKKIQSSFFSIVNAEDEARHSWLTFLK